VSSCVPWTFEDFEGDNPFESAGTFDFNIWYELDYPDPEQPAFYSADFEITGVTCTHVKFDGGGDVRRATDDENEQLADWFSSYIDGHLDEYEAIKDHAFQYSFVDADDE